MALKLKSRLEQFPPAPFACVPISQETCATLFRMRTITLEEHFASPGFMQGPGREVHERSEKTGNPPLRVFDQLANIGEKRITEMDAAGIDVQVLSLTAPGVEQLDTAAAIALSRESNDFLAAATKTFPKRFAGFASLPTCDPVAAASELDRAVRELGFKGALINGHSRGRYLDDKFFWPILERAEKLSVPIYLHPTPPPKAVIEASFGGLHPSVTEIISGPGWGWHIETAVHVIRMVLGGVFDKFPNLQIIIGHMGEAIPFMLPRFSIMPAPVTKLGRPITAYFRENVHYTFGGFNYTPTFLALYLQLGVERIMFSVDYPYGSMEQARQFLEQLPISPADRERIAHINAERLLKL